MLLWRFELLSFLFADAFECVRWNFPCIGRGLGEGQDGQNSEMEGNKELLRKFALSATRVIAPGGQVHVTHKTKPPYNHWEIAKQIEIGSVRARADHPVRPDLVLTTAELPFRFTQNVRTDVNSG